MVMKWHGSKNSWEECVFCKRYSRRLVTTQNDKGSCIRKEVTYIDIDDRVPDDELPIIQALFKE